EQFRLGFFNADEGFYNFPAPLRWRPTVAASGELHPEAPERAADEGSNAVLVRRLAVPQEWSGADLVDRLERTDPRRLLGPAEGEGTTPWDASRERRQREDDDEPPPPLVLAAAPNEYGAQAMAAATEWPRDVRVEASVRRGSTRAVYLLARYG